MLALLPANTTAFSLLEPVDVETATAKEIQQPLQCGADPNSVDLWAELR